MTNRYIYNAIAERTCLGYALVNTAWCNVLTGIVDSDDYLEERHRYYHAAFVDLGHELTIPRLMDYLREVGCPEIHRSQSYIGELMDCAGHSEPSARKCADDVHRYAKIRTWISVTREIYNETGVKGWRPDGEWIDGAERRWLGAIRDTREHKHTVLLADNIPVRLQAFETAGTQDETVRVVKTGFRDIDKIIGGMKGGDLVIIAGRPSMGKSALAVAIGWGRGDNDPVQTFSAEMDEDELTDRMLSAKARVDNYRLSNGGITDDDWQRLIDGATGLSGGTPMYLTDCSSWRIGKVCSEARVMAATKGIGLVIVDYIQLLSGDTDARYTNREREISSITRALKGLAKELDIPVIALSQLNRDLEKRDDKRPIMSDLRESGAIEQDADKIMFLYRDEVYNKDTSWVGVAEVNIAKNRGGRIGRARLRWTPEFTRFDDFDGVDR
jgi:replicative DNA helicase